jgi:Abnormal spindle-like microcephaly-assoc'd, ASPM-SPD-2-Hydin
VTIAIIAVAGCGVSELTLVPSATKVEFGNVAVGGSTSQLVTLTNMGKVNVSIAKVSASGKGFSVSGGSNVVLAPSQAVTVSVGFNPSAAGKATGTLSVTSDALSGRSVRIALSGSGDATSGKHSVALSWQASSQAIGYFVYRSSTGSGALSKLNATLNESTSFTDSTVASGETYQYVVTSVNSSNVESAASNGITVTIPSP